MADADVGSPSRSSGYGMHIAAASAKQVVRGRRWLRALQGAVDSTSQSVGSQGAKIFAKGSEALAMVDQRLGLSEAASAAEQRMQISEKISEKVAAADRRLQLSAKAQALSQDWQELRGKADTQQGKLMSQLNKAVVRAATSLSSLNSRQLAQALDPKALCFYDAGEFPGCRGLVALTIDDAPCRGETSMLCEMKELLQEFDARATFFLCTDSVPGHEDALVDLIRAGSEVANHGCSDQPYGGLTESEFGAVFHRAERSTGQQHDAPGREPAASSSGTDSCGLSDFHLQVAGSSCLGGSDCVLPGCHQLHAIHPAVSRHRPTVNKSCSWRPQSACRATGSDLPLLGKNVCEALRAKARGEEPPEPTVADLQPVQPPVQPPVQAAEAAEAAQAPLVAATNEAADALPTVKALPEALPEAISASSAPSASSASSALGPDLPGAAEASEGDPTTKRNWALGLSGLASGLARLPERSQPKAVEAAEVPVVPQSPYRWFRAPHADLSPNMQKVLSQNGFTNVLCDSFANDTQILDSSFIAETLLSLVDPRGGSIIVIHTPEPGFREHNFEALEILLQGLAERQLRAVTVTELTEAALRTPSPKELPVSGVNDAEHAQS
eukprot:s358_g35.t1